MADVYLFQLAAQRVGYLSGRQSLIAGNVANVSTPGFKALDLKPFSAALQETEMTMATTDPAHLTPAAAEIDAPRAGETDADETTVSGNSVDLEGEMVKLGEISRDYSEAMGVRKTFHQMMMQALK